MNKLKHTREILKQTNISKQVVGTPSEEQRLIDALPKVEPERKVRVATALNVLLKELKDDEVDSDIERRLYTLRNKIEPEAVELIKERLEVEENETSFQFTKNEIVDPVSKARYEFSDSPEMYNSMFETMKDQLARSVVDG